MKEAERVRLLKSEGLSQELARQKRDDRLQKALLRQERGSYQELIHQAGLFSSARVWVTGAVLGSAAAGLLLFSALGPLVAVVAFGFLATYLTSGFLHGRAENRRQAVLAHLPAFIDAIEASIRTGYSVEQSIQNASDALPDGVLREECHRVSSLLSHNASVEEAMNQLPRRIAGQEIVALTVAIRLFAGIGGRMLEPLERLGRKMREQQAVVERARRDLVATKHAFYVILGLSIVAPAMLYVIQPEYFSEAVRHQQISIVIQLAVVMQVACLFAFKRLITLRV